MNGGIRMYNTYGYNPYMQQQSRFQTLEPTGQPINTQPINNQYGVQPQTTLKQNYLLGKSVESIDVVKAMDIGFDGINYFPLMDGSAIITKQIQMDGTSKTIIYKPIDEPKQDTIKYATTDELQEVLEKIESIDVDDLKDEIKDIKKDLKDLKKKKGD